MSSPRGAVCVAVDPFLLRSALYRYLLRDARFDTLLCPQGQDVRAFARTIRAQAVLATTHIDVPQAHVILIPAAPQGTSVAATDDLQALADHIASAVAHQLDGSQTLTAPTTAVPWP